MTISNSFLKLSFVKDVAIRNAFVECNKDTTYKRSLTDKVINLILFNPTLSDADKLTVNVFANYEFTLNPKKPSQPTLDFGLSSDLMSVQLNQIAGIFKIAINYLHSKPQENLKLCDGFILKCLCEYYQTK